MAQYIQYVLPALDRVLEDQVILDLPIHDLDQSNEYPRLPQRPKDVRNLLQKENMDSDSLKV